MASWPPSTLPIAQGEPGIGRARGQRVVRPLAERRADRVDRRQVDHVEAHRRRGLEPLVGASRRCPRSSVSVVLVPRARPGSAGRTRTRRRTARPCGRRRSGSPGWGRPARAGRSAVMAARTSSASTTSSRSSTCCAGVEARRLRPRSSAASCGRPGLPRPAGRRRRTGPCPRCRPGATSMPAGILISALCTQVSHGSLQPSTRNVHGPSVSSATVGGPPVEAERGGRVHRLEPLAAAGVGQHHRGVDRVVALAEHRGPDRNRFTDDRLGRVGATLDHRRHLGHRDPIEDRPEGRLAEGDSGLASG